MASISKDVLARYAGDAAREVAGVRALAARRATKVTERGGGVTVELHLALVAGAAVPVVGRAVQERVRGYLTRMADLERVVVNVVVDEL